MKTFKKIIYSHGNGEARYEVVVTINGQNPEFHKVVIRGFGMYKEVICSTAELSDTYLKLEFDARMRLNTSFEVEDKISANLLEDGFEEVKDAEIIQMKK